MEKRNRAELSFSPSFFNQDNQEKTLTLRSIRKRLSPIAVEGDSDGSLLSWLEVLLVHPSSVSVAKDEVVAYDPRLGV